MPNVSKNNWIPVNVPVISEEAKKYVTESLEAGWISSAGPYVERFEQAFSKYLGMKHGVAVSSGTAALHCALSALQLKEGDEVIVPAFTMIATIFAVMYTGAKPVFVDCELETFNIDPKKIEEKITSKTKAIMPVHIFGHACEMDEIEKIAKHHGLCIIEDAAEAHGGLYKNRKCGAMSELAAFSFYANKIITTGEGGMVVTNNDRLATRLRKVRDLFHSDTKRFIHEEIGYNYRLTNVQAAIGLGQLQHIEEYIQKKIAIAEHYHRKLRDIPGIQIPQTRPYVRNVFWMYSILIDEKKLGLTKDSFREALRVKGVETRDLFYSPTDQPVLQKRYGNIGAYPNTDYVAAHGCYLPSGLALKETEIDRVCEAIHELA